MEIEVKTIPHSAHRYAGTCGDWQLFDGLMHVRVSATGNEDYDFLIALHEILEAWLCHRRGIAEQDVTDFDKAFQGEGEPGDDPKSPYKAEHFFATTIERLVAQELGINWAEYSQVVDSL